MLRWSPVGEGGRVARRTSWWWEVARARVQGRAPQRLFHASLQVTAAGLRHDVELVPAWGTSERDRGAVAQGPVGACWLGRSRFFRYEVRTWPDRPARPGTFHELSRDPDVVAQVLVTAPQVPLLVWGRAAGPSGDMWSSNSFVSWLLAVVGLPTDVPPPDGGSAPGWTAGVEVAHLGSG